MRIRDWSSDVCSSDLEVVVDVAVARLAEGFGEGDGELALAAEIEDGIADFLHLGEAEIVGAEMDQHPLYPRVAAGGVEAAPQIGARDDVARGGPGEGGVRQLPDDSVARASFPPADSRQARPPP